MHSLGTGVVSLILHNFPFGNTFALAWAGRVMFFVNLLLFLLFCGLTLARYIIYPKVEDQIQSLIQM
jgi:tellurite resistance protein TehA-like permease